MQAVGNGVNVVVLDAWRNNLAKGLFRSFNPELAQVNAFGFGWANTFAK